MISKLRDAPAVGFMRANKNLFLLGKAPQISPPKKTEKKLMDNSEKEIKEITLETPKTRKKNLLTDPESLWRG